MSISRYPAGSNRANSPRSHSDNLPCFPGGVRGSAHHTAGCRTSGSFGGEAREGGGRGGGEGRHDVEDVADFGVVGEGAVDEHGAGEAVVGGVEGEDALDEGEDGARFLAGVLVLAFVADAEEGVACYEAAVVGC